MKKLSDSKLTQLDNGLIVATAQMPYMRSVSVGLWTAIGSRYEPEHLNGASHFIEHILFKGTKRRSAEQISSEIESFGGHINAWTSEESTCFHSIARAERFEDILDVLMDMFHNSRFAQSDIIKEREVIKSEIAMYRDQPNQYIEDLINETMWQNHPLGRPITGTEKSVNNIKRTDLLLFKKKNYLSTNSAIIVAGNITHNSVLKAVKNYAGYFVKGVPPDFEPAIINKDKPTINLKTRDVEQTHIALGFYTCSRHSPLRYAVRVLNAIVADKMSSRLFKLLREESGLVYNIYSSPNFMEDTGDWVIFAGLDDDNLHKTLRLIVQELKKLTHKKISNKELNETKEYLIGQFELNLESTENQMNFLGEQIIGFRKLQSPDTIIDSINAVTAEDVRLVARNFIKPERANLAIISSIKDTSDIEPILNGLK